MKVTLIVAMARNGVIGRGNALPWRLPEDLARFKRVTMGHPIVMGRKTWDSIGRPLPGRRSIVVTRNPSWRADGAERAASVAEAIAACEGVEEVFVIGGAEVFRDALGLADALDVTEIEADVDGDVFFPMVEPADWIETSREGHEARGDDPLPFAFVHYARRWNDR